MDKKELASLQTLFKGRKIFVAASTHENEENLILNAYKKNYGKLIVVPRHPERFLKVEELIKNYIKDKNDLIVKIENKKNVIQNIIKDIESLIY